MFQAVIRPEAIELMPLGVYVVDASGVIRQYNAQAVDLWGRAPEAGAEACAWGGSDPLDPMGEQPNPIAEVLADGLPRRAERVIVRPDGRRVHVSLSVGALRGAGGAVTGAVVCAQDVSRRLRTEQALHEVGQLYKAIVETAVDGIWTVNADGRVTFVNERLATMLGYRPVEIVARPGVDFLDPAERAQVADRWARRTAGQSDQYQVRMRRRDGAVLLAQVSASPLIDPDGRFAGAFAVVRDVTSADGAARLMAGQKRVLEMLATGRPLADVLGALAGTIEDLVPGMLCGVLVVDPARPDRLVKGVAPSLPPGYWESFEWLPVLDGCWSCGTAAATGRRCAVEDIAADARWAGEPAAAATAHGLRACWSEPIFGPGGVVAGTFGCYFREPRGPRAAETAIVEEAAHLAGVALQHDRWRAELLAATAEAQAARAKAEADRLAAEAANRAKDQFLASLSHELRTPLSPVLLTASSLARDPALPAHLRADMEMVQRSVELEARLIDDLLDHARIARGMLELYREEVDVHALLWRAAETSSAADSYNKHVAVEARLSAGRHIVHADATRLQQVFWNLLRNAVKFTPDGGTVTISTWNVPAAAAGDGDGDGDGAGGRLVIEVRDTGIGIDPGALPGIFEAFRQADESIGKRFGGLGLGLAICESLVKMHGGTIRAASDGDGHGSAFTVELPVTAGGGATPVAPATPVRDARALRILFVEDHAASLQVLTRLLKSLGHEVTAAQNVAEAVAALHGSEAAFDLLLSDLGLPDGSGLDVLREAPPGRVRKAIALTGFGMDEDIRRSMEAGFVRHLVKPVHFEKLKGVLGELFG
ncbi:MAG TPA: PAS domain S-box protein [Tepidisphaeraceae bacterium]|nr:PAS domain S-box protein [Tepidisphaeraceae bacterium]